MSFPPSPVLAGFKVGREIGMLGEASVRSRRALEHHAWLRHRRGDHVGVVRLVAAMDVTYYVALPFVPSDDGAAAGEAVECLSANAAVMRAEALSRKPGCAGAIAFSRSGDPAAGEFGDAKLIRKFGDVPDYLSAL